MRMKRLTVVGSLLVIAAAVVAAGVYLLQSQETLTPTEIVHAAACGDGIPSDVDAVVSWVALDSLDDPYDLTQPEERMTLHLNGNNSEARLTLGGNQTTITKNGYRYRRDGDEPWEVHYLGDSGAFSTCPAAAGVSDSESSQESATAIVMRALGSPTEGTYEYRGEVTLNGVRTKHYAKVDSPPVSAAADADATTDTTPQLGTPRNPIYDDVWLNSSGQFARIEGRLTLGDIHYHSKFRVDYSGHNEANDIDAPFAIPFISARDTYTDRVANVQLPAALNAPGPVTYSISPALPNGLALDPATQRITGTPTATVDYAEYTLAATSGAQTATRTFFLAVSAAPEAVTLYVGQPYDVPIHVVHRSAFTITPSLPPGLTSSVEGHIVTLLKGTPTTATPAREYTMIWESPGETIVDVFSIAVVDLPPLP